MNAKTKTEVVINLKSTCNCGCYGTDHRKQYRRVVTTTETFSPPANEGDTMKVVVLAKGTAQLPFGMVELELRAFTRRGKICMITPEWTRVGL